MAQQQRLHRLFSTATHQIIPFDIDYFYTTVTIDWIYVWLQKLLSAFSPALTFSNVQFSLHHNSYFAGFPKGPNMSENERKIAFGESTKWQFTRLMTPWNLWSSLFSTCPYFHGVFFGAFEDGRWPSNRSWLREQKVLCSEKLNV